MSYRDDFLEVEGDSWWSFPRILVGILVLSAALFLLGFVSDSFNLFSYKFFAPRNEAARRQVLEQSKAYRQGSIQRLDTLCTQVSAADDDHKPMINDVISHEFAEWDISDAPAYLRGCLINARR